MFRTGKVKLNLDLAKMEKAGVAAVGVRPKIEIVRVSSSERKNFRPLDGVQLRATYSHMIVGTYCPTEPTTTSEIAGSVSPLYESKAAPLEISRKYKKNLGPVSRLLKRRHQVTSLATKSCDNIYSSNKSSNYHDWKVSQRINDRGLEARKSNSLDWRGGQRIDSSSPGNLDWVNSCQSAEQLCVNGTLTCGNLATPTTKSRIVSLLRRLSPRLPRPGSKGSLPSTPSNTYPWVHVEYSNTDCSECEKRGNDENLENDLSFQREIKLNEVRKKIAKTTPLASPSSMHQSNFPSVKTSKGKKSPTGIPRGTKYQEELDIRHPYLRA